MSIKNLVEMIKHNGLLTSMAQLEKLYRIAIENEEKLAESEARCTALAAENALLKKSEPAPFSKLMMEALDVYQAGADEVPELAMLSAYKKLRDGLKTPATDAFLAEVRNEAGALAVELFAQTLGSPYSVRDEKCYEDGFTRAIEVVRDIQAPRFAYKIRQAGM